uniref:F-box protein CPR1-like n=1 Tax=Tanacetum cinerariifolium TaxID=118510 RepID=A0A6L2N3J6_TANCI|nr:F-box protein CPR1-like [Tanacetum cinerariifolium]
MEKLIPDIYEKILVTLDVKNLVRCKSVCKSWKFLISDSRLIKAHLNHSCSNNEYGHSRMGELNYTFCSYQSVSIFCNRAPHWAMYTLNQDRRVEILSFDLSQEKFKEISQPVDSKHKNILVGIMEECLCIVTDELSTNDLGTKNYNIWVMQKYNVNHSWKMVERKCCSVKFQSVDRMADLENDDPNGKSTQRYTWFFKNQNFTAVPNIGYVEIKMKCIISRRFTRRKKIALSGQRKSKIQWAPEERKVANLDQRLKSLIMSVLSDDQMNSVINCLTAKSTWGDLILYHEGPSDMKESRVMDMKLCYNTFEFKEDFEAKYNKVKAKPALLSSSASYPSSSSSKNSGLVAETYDWVEEKVSSNDNEVTEVKALMILADKERVFVKKKKCQKCNKPRLSEAEDSTLSNHVTANESLVGSIPLSPLKKLDAPARGNKRSSASKTNSAPAGKLKNVKMEDDPPLAIVMKELKELKLQISKNKLSYSRNKSSLQIDQHHIAQGETYLRSRPSRPVIPLLSCIHCGIISLRREIKPRNLQHITKNCETYGCNVYTTTDHNNTEWFRKREALQAKKAEFFKVSKTESSSALGSKTPIKRWVSKQN